MCANLTCIRRRIRGSRRNIAITFGAENYNGVATNCENKQASKQFL